MVQVPDSAGRNGRADGQRVRRFESDSRRDRQDAGDERLHVGSDADSRERGAERKPTQRRRVSVKMASDGWLSPVELIGRPDGQSRKRAESDSRRGSLLSRTSMFRIRRFKCSDCRNPPEESKGSGVVFGNRSPSPFSSSRATARTRRNPQINCVVRPSSACISRCCLSSVRGGRRRAPART